MLVKLGVVVAIVISLSACQTVPEKTSFAIPKQVNKYSSIQQKYSKSALNQDLEAFLEAAENQAEFGGRKVLSAGRKMVLQEKAVIRGSCWDYANAIYNRAGYENLKTERQLVFKGTRKGPFAKPQLIKPGDFLSHLNHAHHRGVHSAIFVGWQDYARQQALMLSYAGERKSQPARYKIYDLSNVYQIVRAQDKLS